jgi:glycosyltransferase involved in cell wall biosynthesis
MAGALAQAVAAPAPLAPPARDAVVAAPRRALVLAPQPFFSGRGTPFSVYFRTRALADLGVSVDLLTYGEGDDIDLPNVRIVRIPRVPFCSDVRVGPSGVKLILDILLMLWTIGMLLRHRYSFVHAHEESVFWAGWLKPIFGFRLVYDMHSSLPQQLRNFGYTDSRIIVRTFERLERAALDNADAVITICPDLERYAVSVMPDRERHLLIENSVFGDVRLKARRATRYPYLGAEALRVPEGRPVLLYAGTFERYQGLDLLVRAFARARPRLGNAVLVLVGGTPSQVEALRAEAKTLGLGDSCVVIGRVAPDHVRDLIGRASVLLSPRIDGTNTPLKVYEQLASGIPLVATRIYSHTQVLNEDVCFLVDPTEPAMAEGLVSALTDLAARARVSAAARELYAARYSPQAYEAKMRRLLEVLG